MGPNHQSLWSYFGFYFETLSFKPIKKFSPFSLYQFIKFENKSVSQFVACGLKKSLWTKKSLQTKKNLVGLAFLS